MKQLITPKRLAIAALVMAVTGLPGASMIWAGETFHPILHPWFLICMFLWLPLLIASAIWQASLKQEQGRISEGDRKGTTAFTPARALLFAAVLLLVMSLILVSAAELPSPALIVIAICSLLVPPLTLYGVIGLVIHWRKRVKR